jgi:cation diffusion facilitator family transporter
MRDPNQAAAPFDHSHSFLGRGHGANERRTWAVIWLCGAMMVGEIVGGLLFGSIALVADGLHMSTHAGALLLAALAYTYARKLDDDQRFTFGTGKLGDLAGFTSAIILAMIALLIAYESVSRLFSPVPIHFAEAIPIACLGLVVNLASAWLLSGGHHHHGHAHAHDHGAQGDHDEAHRLTLGDHAVRLEIFEEGVPPVFRLRAESGASLVADACAIETLRPDGTRQSFAMADRGRCLESIEEVGEPHQFEARVRIGADEGSVGFEEPEHAHAKAGRDNNLRAAVVHVVADAAVSMFVIVGLLLAGACVIASWSFGLIRDTGAILLDMNPDRRMADSLRRTIECDGDRLADLHLWRLGPGHLGAIVSVRTRQARGLDFYRARLARFSALSHLTIEIQPF